VLRLGVRGEGGRCFSLFPWLRFNLLVDFPLSVVFHAYCLGVLVGVCHSKSKARTWSLLHLISNDLYTEPFYVNLS
jgi:hypothetical protein